MWRSGELIIREGTDPKVLSIFYMAVTQAVILFLLEPWRLSAVMKRTVEGTHTRFLKNIIGKGVQRKAYETWVTSKVEVVR